MGDIKLTPAEQDLFNEVGSRGDYFREAIRDEAADQVNQTGQMTEITTEGGEMIDVDMPGPAITPTTAPTVTEVVPPTDFEPVAGGS
jgi:hypothetical protein